MLKWISATVLVMSMAVIPAAASSRTVTTTVKPPSTPPGQMLPVKFGSDRMINPQPLPPKVAPRT